MSSHVEGQVFAGDPVDFEDATQSAAVEARRQHPVDGGDVVGRLGRNASVTLECGSSEGVHNGLKLYEIV